MRARRDPARTGVVGYVPGAYDMFHIGHLNILRRARQGCDHLIAGVVTDEVLKVAKGRGPIVPHAERMAIVGGMSCVDEVVTDVSSDKLVMWERLGFDVLFKGDDWKGTEKGDRLERDLGGVGVRVVYFPYTVHTSSTALRQLISAPRS
ncbi:adenylyltransferase/cytidyltransferase family protein [Actinomadura hibisca]|uniref:adenylyltransferase/cytidyltransferase family protein n=1 Tax=Actinomadura hibisca TaxID=68565 RepID=UPI00082FDB09|nr:adenylyltransferase/cytidyltransferase family protein [Actinomadura hibisca]